MNLDIAAFRAHFPALLTGIAFFDGPGGTQAPAAVGAAMAGAITGPLSNRGSGVLSETNADAAVGGFRQAMADLLGAHPRGVVYGRSATQLAYDFSRHLAKSWGPGDEVVVSRLDHDSNIRPWLQAAEAVGATVRWIEFDPGTTEIDEASVAAAITGRTRLVAVTAASNLLGTKPPLRRIADAAHAVGALVYVDGVHYTAHAAVDVQELGADFFACSPYKFLGPHCGVLVADPELLESLQPDKLLPSTNEVPERFEFGTLPYEIMAGVTATVDFLAAIAPGTATGRRARLLASAQVLDAHELTLRHRLEAGLAELGEAVTLHSRARERTPTLLVTFPGRSSADAYRYLADRDVLAPAGSFYAYEAFRRLDLEDSAALRIGVAPYNDDDDVDRLLAGLGAFVAQ
ncbi:cysteine desulfurase-like protein [Arthrobacter sp. N1]|uniref:cysteine desulfurase-like protein n=1 Tax=Arthrobacter sp. N1 TaxID=619291 RepID=UPI003BAEAE19